MGDLSENLATVALVISLIALATSTGQLLQQLFGTAEGYRKCQDSVIGPWAEKTKRKWRWTQFRFETLYTTPEILIWRMNREDKYHLSDLARPNVAHLDDHSDAEPRQTTYFMTGTDRCREIAMSRKRPDEPVSWLGFLDQVQAMSYDVLTHRSDNRLNFEPEREKRNKSRRDSAQLKEIASNMLSLPALRFKQRTWDLIPPEIVTPYASTNIGDVISIAHRLGMIWTDLQPEHGVLRAEGNGHTLSSTLVRSLGILLRYTYHSPNTRYDKVDSWRNYLIPSDSADKLGFGILPGCRELGIQDLTVNRNGTKDHEDNDFGPFDDIIDIIGLDDGVKEELRENLAEFRYLEGFCDIVCLATPFLPQYGSSIIQVPTPHYSVTSSLDHAECFVVFRERPRGLSHKQHAA